MNNPWFLIETWITQVSIWVKTKFWCWECDYPSEIAENWIKLCPETVKIFLVFILMSTPLFCLLIPYMGNREVCLEYCTGIRSKRLLQLRVGLEWCWIKPIYCCSLQCLQTQEMSQSIKQPIWGNLLLHRWCFLSHHLLKASLQVYVLPCAIIITRY